MASGPGQVLEACDAAAEVLADAFSSSAVTGSLGEWAAVLASAQRVIDTASAVQDAAIVRLAAIETELADDGTLVETHRALGHMALDAPAVVSGALTVSGVHAERRVRAAVRMAADGPGGSDTHTGLSGLHAAMRDGRLDSFRASVVADELELAPPEVAAAVVAAVEGHFGDEDAPHLRRRCRRVLARISPDLLRQRAERARAESGLRRWVDEPGVDRWEGSFPSEEAGQAWAAIDALAQRYVAQAVCATIERARAKALTDLVAGNATVETVVTLTVPAAALPDAAAAAAAAGGVLHERPEEGTVGEPGPPARGVVDRPAERDAAGRVAEGKVDDHRAALGAGDDHRVALGAGDDLRVALGAADDLVEITGLAAGQPVLVSRPWLASRVAGGRAGQGSGTGATVHFAQCHPVTGALLDAATDPPTTDLPPVPGGQSIGGKERQAREPRAERYRPSPRIATRVRARDRRCRFPGCSVSAVFCDLDHVRPWPAGRTAHANLLSLCRRHHRVKQRPGWRVVLAADGVATWTEPTGRVRSTRPVDALRATVLTGGPPTTCGDAAPTASASRPRLAVPDGPHTALEFQLEHVGAAATTPPTLWRDHAGRHCIEIARRAVGTTFTVELGSGWPHRRTRPTQRCRDADEPPF